MVRSARASAIFGAVLASLTLAGSAVALPEGRGYELVTPAIKPQEPSYGTNGFAFGATDDGDHVVFHSVSTLLADSPDFPTTYRSDRSTSGAWSTSSPIPRGATLGQDVQLRAYSSDAQRIVAWTFNSYDPRDKDDRWLGNADLYAFGPGPATELMTPKPFVEDGTYNDGRNLVSATDDARAIIFDESGGHPLLPGVGSAYHELYEFRDGSLRYPGVDTSGTQLTTGGTTAGVAAGYLGLFTFAGNSYSRDGSRIFFTAYPGGDPSDRPGLYVRTNDAVTDPIPATPVGANASSMYLGATPDGSMAFFKTNLALTAGDHDADQDLYAYDTSTKSVTLLSSAVADGLEIANQPVWASDDGSTVYYTVADVGGASNFATYVWDHGASREIADTSLIPDPFSYGNVTFTCGPTRATPDGRYLLVQTGAALVPSDDDHGAVDVYRYDLESGSWALVSTGPIDDHTGDGAYINQRNNFSTGYNGCDPALAHLTHPISDDGRYVFFETRAALVPGDANGRVDVYQWDSETGKTSLITSGRGDTDANLLDATPTGSDVFVATRERLLSSDIDGSQDVYDARIGTAVTESHPPVPCRDSECQGAPGGGFTTSTPGSATLDARTPVAPVRAARRLRLSRLSSAVLRRLATGRAVRFKVVAAVNGRLTVTGSVSLAARHVGVPSSTTSGRAGRSATVTLRLGAAARRLLRHSGTARLRLVAHQLETAPARASFVLPHVKGAAR